MGLKGVIEHPRGWILRVRECRCRVGKGRIPGKLDRKGVIDSVNRGSGGPGLTRGATQAPTGTRWQPRLCTDFSWLVPGDSPDQHFSPDCFHKITRLVHESLSNGDVGTSGSQAHFPCLSCGIRMCQMMLRFGKQGLPGL